MAHTCEPIRIATRRSPLALRQAELVAAALRARDARLALKMTPLTTRGDAAAEAPRARPSPRIGAAGGKGLFTKELDRSLLDGRADVAVHSMKDVPAAIPDGVVIAAILRRADAADAFVSNDYPNLEHMPRGALIGSASLRRRCQIKHRYPWLAVRDLHGNVGSRLDRLDAGDCDGLILACAGLERLRLAGRIRTVLPCEVMTPAAGQGAIGVACRADDERALALLAALDDRDTRVCVDTERALARRLGADCRWPLAAYATLADGQLRLRSLVGDGDGARLLRDERSGAARAGERLARAAADALLAKGAAELLAHGAT